MHHAFKTLQNKVSSRSLRSTYSGHDDLQPEKSEASPEKRPASIKLPWRSSSQRRMSLSALIAIIDPYPNNPYAPSNLLHAEMRELSRSSTPLMKSPTISVTDLSSLTASALPHNTSPLAQELFQAQITNGQPKAFGGFFRNFRQFAKVTHPYAAASTAEVSGGIQTKSDIRLSLPSNHDRSVPQSIDSVDATSRLRLQIRCPAPPQPNTMSKISETPVDPKTASSLYHPEAQSFRINMDAAQSMNYVLFSGSQSGNGPQRKASRKLKRPSTSQGIRSIEGSPCSRGRSLLAYRHRDEASTPTFNFTSPPPGHSNARTRTHSGGLLPLLLSTSTGQSQARPRSESDAQDQRQGQSVVAQPRSLTLPGPGCEGCAHSVGMECRIGDNNSVLQLDVVTDGSFSLTSHSKFSSDSSASATRGNFLDTHSTLRRLAQQLSIKRTRSSPMLRASAQQQDAPPLPAMRSMVDLMEAGQAYSLDERQEGAAVEHSHPTASSGHLVRDFKRIRSPSPSREQVHENPGEVLHDPQGRSVHQETTTPRKGRESRVRVKERETIYFDGRSPTESLCTSPPEVGGLPMSEDGHSTLQSSMSSSPSNYSTGSSYTGTPFSLSGHAKQRKLLQRVLRSEDEIYSEGAWGRTEAALSSVPEDTL